LGHWDGDTGGYIGKARRIGASYFDLGKVYRELQPWEQKAANFHFLDKIAERGDTVLLSVPKYEIRRGSALIDEIRYLTHKKGYRWINQWSLKRVD